MKKRLAYEPVMIGGVFVALIETLIVMLVALEVVDLTGEQTAAIMAFVVALVAVVPVISAWVTRNLVKPMAKIRDDASRAAKAHDAAQENGGTMPKP